MKCTRFNPDIYTAASISYNLFDNKFRSVSIQASNYHRSWRHDCLAVYTSPGGGAVLAAAAEAAGPSKWMPAIGSVPGYSGGGEVPGCPPELLYCQTFCWRISYALRSYAPAYCSGWLLYRTLLGGADASGEYSIVL